MSASEIAGRLRWLVEDHETWRGRKCLNLNAAEAVMSRRARGLLASDLATQPIAKMQTKERALSDSIGRSRFTLWLLSIFAAAALLLAAFGVYGVISSFVTGRRHELGVRMALGATKANVIKLVVYQGLAPMVFGTAMGLAAAWGLTRFMASLLYDVTATDPLTFTLVPLVLLAAALP